MVETGSSPPDYLALITEPSDDVKVHVETTTQCGGSCGGCALTENERLNGRLVPLATLETLSPFIAAYLAESVARGGVKEASVNCIQADHLLSDPADLAALVRWICSVGGGEAVGFITASAIGKRDRVARAVEAIHTASHQIGQPVWLDVVFDPAKTALDKFSAVYRDNIDLIRSAFGDVDLNLNVGPDTARTVDPARLHEFLDGHGFLRFSINLAPTPGTAESFAANWASITDWIGRFLDGWNPAGPCEVNIAQIFSSYALVGGDVWSPDLGQLVGAVEDSATRSICVEAGGWFSHSQAGFGDAPFLPRVGWRPTHRAELVDGKALPAVEASARAFAARIARLFIANESCSACRFRPVCSRSGVAALRLVMDRRLPDEASGGCPAGIRSLLQRFDSYLADGRLGRIPGDRPFEVRIPPGFDDGIRSRAVSMKRRPLRSLDFGFIKGTPPDAR